MRKILSASLAVCATLALATSQAPLAADGVNARRRPKRRAHAAAAQKTPAPARRQQQRPAVREINEEGLKSLLRPGEPRQRPLVVNFWATWCAPCREEFPDFVKLRRRYDAGRLDLLLVSLDDISDINTAVPDFLIESGAAALPTYLLNAADEGAAIALVDPRWGGELPATFLYDRSGRLVFNHKGRIDPAELQSAVDKALAARPQSAGSER